MIRFRNSWILTLLLASILSCGSGAWSKEKAHSDLVLAKQIWELNSVDSYSIRIEVYPKFYDLDIDYAVAFFDSGILVQLSIFKEGVEKGENVDLGSDNTVLMHARGIPEMFDWVDDIIESDPYDLEVNYDGTYGFPVKVVLQSASPDSATDTYSEYNYSDFKTISNFKTHQQF